jgi:hypothetical protein
MNPQRIAIRTYPSVASIPTAATNDLHPPTMMSLATGTLCVAPRPAHVPRHTISSMLNPIAIRRSTGCAGRQTARTVLIP